MLGIPSNLVMAPMIGAMIIKGVQPGPNVIAEKPEIFWEFDRVHVSEECDDTRFQVARLEGRETP
jgi:hypothetical protein